MRNRFAKALPRYLVSGLFFVTSIEALAQDGTTGTEPVPVELGSQDPVDTPDTGTSASSSRSLPVRYTARPLSLVPGTLRIEAGFTDMGISSFGMIGGLPTGGNARGLVIGKMQGSSKAVAGLGFGASMGLIPNLEAGIHLLPIIFAPDFDFGDIVLHGRYQFLSGEFDVAAQLQLLIPTNSFFAIGLGAPVGLRLGPQMKLETGLELEIMATPGDASLQFELPASFLFSIDDGLFIGGRSGFAIPVSPKAALVIPLGVVVGYSMPIPGGQLVDIFGGFMWPSFIHSSAGVVAELWQIQIGGNFHLSVPGLGG